jgi:hypothetical protein
VRRTDVFAILITALGVGAGAYLGTFPADIVRGIGAALVELSVVGLALWLLWNHRGVKMGPVVFIVIGALILGVGIVWYWIDGAGKTEPTKAVTAPLTAPASISAAVPPPQVASGTTIASTNQSGGQTAQTIINNNADSSNQDRIEGLLTGGDSYAYFMLYWFDLDQNIAKQSALIRKGSFPLFNLSMRILDMDANRNILTQSYEEVSGGGDTAGAIAGSVTWKLPESVYYRIFFMARNGPWTQDLQLKKSTKANCWLAATRVKGKRGQILFEHSDSGYTAEFGSPIWRQ